MMIICFLKSVQWMKSICTFSFIDLLWISENVYSMSFLVITFQSAQCKIMQPMTM